MLRWFIQGGSLLRLVTLIVSLLGMTISALAVYLTRGHPFLLLVFLLWCVPVGSMFHWAWGDHQDDLKNRQLRLQRKNASHE